MWGFWWIFPLGFFLWDFSSDGATYLLSFRRGRGPQWWFVSRGCHIKVTVTK
jgi:hypothetical protein